MELAKQKPGWVLSLQQTVEQFICRALQGEELSWPPAADSDFYDQFLDQAIANGLDCLLCHQLKPTPAWQQLPDDLREQLDQRARNAIAVEMARASDLATLNEGLAGAGLEILLLKGSALAYTHYPQPHLRARLDTDIFIDPGKIRQVRAALEGLGYGLVGWTYKSHQFNATREKYGGRVIRYDVHWRANNGTPFARIIDFSEALQQSVPVPKLEGSRTLDPARTLLLACMHRASSAGHRPDRLNWIYDVHLLLTSMTAEDLAEFSRLALNTGMQAICLEALNRSQRCFKTDVSEKLSSQLTTASKPRTLKTRLEASHVALLVDDFRLLPDRVSKREFLSEFLFPPADYLLTRYKKKSRLWLFPLYLRYLLGGMFESLASR